MEKQRGKMFDVWNDDSFWEYGAGAMAWLPEKENGKPTCPTLLVLLPCVPTNPAYLANRKRRASEPHHLLMVNDGKDWRTPGGKVMWDGNREAPTLAGSVLIPGDWHGWIKRGKLVHASDSPHLRAAA